MLFRTLLSFELKKIFQRKSTWITILLLLAFYGLLIGSSVILVMTTSVTNSDNQEESWTETQIERMARDKENGLALSGKILDENLLKEISEEEQRISEESENMGARELAEAQERYQMVWRIIHSITDEMKEITDAGEYAKNLYDGRQKLISEQKTRYQLTKQEERYWEEKENFVKKPFTLYYCEGPAQLVNMHGIYMSLMLVTFLLGIVASRIFAEEHTRKTDQLILCTKLGRSKLYFIKVLAGSIFTLAVTLFFTGIITGVLLCLYGTEGFQAQIQQISVCYPYPLTLGQLFGILVGLELLAALLTNMFTMMLSEIFSSSLISMAVIIGGYFAARLIRIPMPYRLLSQIMNLIPINLVKLDEGIVDLRLVSVFGMKLTSWQFAPILWLALGVVLMWIGRWKYCSYQVGGR